METDSTGTRLGNSEIETTSDVGAAGETDFHDKGENETSVFRDKIRGFTFKFPAGWRVENLGEPEEGRWDLLLSKPGQSFASIHFTFFGSSDRADEIYSREKEVYFNPSKASDISESEVLVKDYETRIVSAQFDDFDIKFMKMFLISGENKLVRFTLAVGDEASEQRTIQLMEDCIDSIDLS